MRWTRKFIPTREQVLTDRKYRWCRSILDKPYLWHFRRHACCRGFAVGAFFSMFPFPVGLFIPSTVVTVKVRGNVAVSFAALWISNPFTIILHWWSAYALGCLLLRRAREPIDFHRITMKWMAEHFWPIYLPMWVGALTMGAAIAVLGYLLVNEAWKARTRRHWRASRAKARRPALQPA